ncbi:hypothetical protein FACS189449_11370 [Alphaproteobacteria bacterium]|nr:hypothetical protein FACS189449_11370 [Alphaproteobacteria bacterium]
MKKKLLIVSFIAVGCVHCMQPESDNKDKESNVQAKLNEERAHAQEMLEQMEVGFDKVDERTEVQNKLNDYLFRPKFTQSICRPMVVKTIKSHLTILPIEDVLFSGISNDFVGEYDAALCFLSKRKVVEIIRGLCKYPVSSIAKILGMDECIRSHRLIGSMVASIDGAGSAKKESLEYVVSLAILCSYFFDKHQNTNYKSKIIEYLTDEYAVKSDERKALYNPDECLVFFTSLLLNLREIQMEKGRESEGQHDNANDIVGFLHELFADDEVADIRDAMKIEFHANFFPEMANFLYSNRILHPLRGKFFLECCFGNYIDIVALHGIANDLASIMLPLDFNSFKDSLQKGTTCLLTQTIVGKYILPKIRLSPNPLSRSPTPNASVRKFVPLFNKFIDMVCDHIEKAVVVTDESRLNTNFKSKPLRTFSINSSIIKENSKLRDLQLVSTISGEASQVQQFFVILDKDYKKMQPHSSIVALALYDSHTEALMSECALGNSAQYFFALNRMTQQEISFLVDLRVAHNYCFCTKNAPIESDDDRVTFGCSSSSSSSCSSSSSSCSSSSSSSSSSCSSDDYSDDSDETCSFIDYADFNDRESKICLDRHSLLPLGNAVSIIADNHTDDWNYHLIAKAGLDSLKSFFKQILMRAIMLCSLEREKDEKDKDMPKIYEGNRELLLISEAYRRLLVPDTYGAPSEGDVFGIEGIDLDESYDPVGDQRDGLTPRPLKSNRITEFTKSNIEKMAEKSREKKKEQGGKGKEKKQTEESDDLVDRRRATSFWGLSKKRSSEKEEPFNVEDMVDIECGHWRHLFLGDSDFSDKEAIDPHKFYNHLREVFGFVKSDIESQPGMFFSLALFRYTFCKFYELVSTIEADTINSIPVSVAQVGNLAQVCGIFLQSLHRCTNARVEGMINALNFLITPNDFEQLCHQENFTLLNALVTNEIFIDFFRLSVVRGVRQTKVEKPVTKNSPKIVDDIPCESIFDPDLRDYAKGSSDDEERYKITYTILYNDYKESARWCTIFMKILNGRYGINIEENKRVDAKHKLEKRGDIIRVQGYIERSRDRGRKTNGKQQESAIIEYPVTMLNNYLKTQKKEFYQRLPLALREKMSNHQNDTDTFLPEVVNTVMDEAIKYCYFNKMVRDVYDVMLTDLFKKYISAFGLGIKTPTANLSKANLLCDIMHHYGVIKEKEKNEAIDASMLSLESMDIPDLQGSPKSTSSRQSTAANGTSSRQSTAVKKSVRGSTSPATPQVLLQLYCGNPAISEWAKPITIGVKYAPKSLKR